MKKFREWLKEAPNTIDMSQSEGMLDNDNPRPPGKYDREEIIGGNNDYTIHGRSWKSPGSKKKFPIHHFIAVHDQTGEAHFSSRGGTTDDGYFIAKNTKKHSDSSMSGPEFYHEILHSGKVKGIQSDHEQTEGGKSIWHRLVHDSKYNDVGVTHHELSTGKQIPLHTGDDWHRNFDQGNNSATVFRAKLKRKTK